MSDDARKVATTIERAETNLARLLDWVGRADAKAPPVIGAATAMLGVIGSLAASSPPVGCFHVLALFLSIGALGVAVLFGFMTIYPQLEGPKRSYLYFRTIARTSKPDFVEAWRSMDDEKYLADLLEQCHQNSLVVDAKFQHLRRAYVAFGVSILPWVATIYLSKG